MKVTMPYRFDPLTNQRGSPHNPPEPRNFGLRIGSIISRDYLTENEDEIRKVNTFEKSVFNKNKVSPRGIKNGTMMLARGINGGFYNPKTLRQVVKVQVEEVLYKQEMEVLA